MKNFKNIIILCIIAAFTVALVQCSKNEFNDKEKVISNIEMRDINPCFPPLNPATCTKEYYPMAITLPTYPGCTFEVGVNLYKCTDGVLIAYHLEDYNMISHNCPQYNIDVLNAINNGTINTFNINFGQQMWNAITQKIMIGTPASFTVMTSNYYIASCSKYCTYEVDRNGFGALVMKKMNCGENCCSLYQKFEKENGIWVLKDRKINTPADPCFGMRPPECPRGSLYSIDCSAQCNVFNF